MDNPKIYSAICAVMNDIGAVGKTSKNTTQGFMFRGIDAVMNAINPALTKHKVFVVPEILEQTRDERTTNKGAVLIYSICKVRYTFYAEDGSHVDAIVIGEGMDSGDKATNKAMSIAFKYACFQVFCIPTEEMVDPDKESHEGIEKKGVIKCVRCKNALEPTKDKSGNPISVIALQELGLKRYGAVYCCDCMLKLEAKKKRLEEKKETDDET